MTDIAHICSESECIYLGQRTTAGMCRCHKSNEEMLHQRVDALASALRAVIDQVNDYERVNNLAPSPGRTECWDSVARAKALLGDVGGSVKP